MSKLVQTVLSQSHTERRAAMATYRELLKKTEHTPADVAAMRAAMIALGKTPENLAADVKAVERRRDLEARIALRTPELDAQIDKAQNAYLDHIAAMEKSADDMRKELYRLQAAQGELEAKRNNAGNAKEDLASLITSNAELFA